MYEIEAMGVKKGGDVLWKKSSSPSRRLHRKKARAVTGQAPEQHIKLEPAMLCSAVRSLPLPRCTGQQKNARIWEADAEPAPSLTTCALTIP